MPTVFTIPNTKGSAFGMQAASGTFARSASEFPFLGLDFQPDLLFVFAQQPTKKEFFAMCRNIRTLHNFEPPATEEEIRASALQYVRKISGFSAPSEANERAFARAVEQVTRASRELLDALVTKAPPRDRETERAKAAARFRARYLPTGEPA